MPKNKQAEGPTATASDAAPVVAAALAGVIYQARLTNRQMKLNIPEDEIIGDVVRLWRNLMREIGER
jgi:hypothetical protein